QAIALVLRADPTQFTITTALRDVPSAGRPPSLLDFYLSWMSPFGKTVICSCRRLLACGIALQFFRKDRDTQIASLHSLHYSELQNFHNLFYRGAGPERVLDMAPRERAWAIDVDVSGIECDQQKFQFLWRKNAFRVELGANCHVLIRPPRIEEEKGIPFFIPVPKFLHFFHAWSALAGLLQMFFAHGAEVFQAADTGFL